MASVIYPPNVFYPNGNETFKIFLAGSIEMDKAEDWQQRMIKDLSEFKDMTIFNPRRLDWDSSWKQEITDENFNEQVNWELNRLDESDFIFMYFDPNTKSPISLLELGLYAAKEKMVVFCPEGFWRKGNVDIVCKRNSVNQVTSFTQAKEYIAIQYIHHLFYKEGNVDLKNVLYKDYIRNAVKYSDTYDVALTEVLKYKIEE